VSREQALVLVDRTAAGDLNDKNTRGG